MRVAYGTVPSSVQRGEGAGGTRHVHTGTVKMKVHACRITRHSRLSLRRTQTQSHTRIYPEAQRERDTKDAKISPMPIVSLCHVHVYLLCARKLQSTNTLTAGATVWSSIEGTVSGVWSQTTS